MAKPKQIPKLPKTKKVLFDLTKFTFLYDTVLVKAIREESVGDLIHPEQYDDKPEFGIVVSTGPGKFLDNGSILSMPVKPGDIVYFGKYTSEETRVEGTDYHLIHAEDIRAVTKTKETSK